LSSAPLHPPKLAFDAFATLVIALSGAGCTASNPPSNAPGSQPSVTTTTPSGGEESSGADQPPPSRSARTTELNLCPATTPDSCDEGFEKPGKWTDIEPCLAFGAPSASGIRDDPQKLIGFAKEQAGKYWACLDQDELSAAAKKHPDKNWLIVRVRFALTSVGKLEKLEVTSDELDTKVTSCMQEVAAATDWARVERGPNYMTAVLSLIIRTRDFVPDPNAACKKQR